MHSLFSKASGLTHDVIGSAIEVHKDKGPGLLESIYEWCLTMELALRGYSTKNQDNVTVRYKQFCRDYPLRYDLLVEGCLFVEVKATQRVGDGTHLKLTLRDKHGRELSAIAFGMADRDPGPGARIDLAYMPAVTSWAGRERLEFTVKEIWT